MEKKKKSWLLRRLWQYLGRNRAMLALALALSRGENGVALSLEDSRAEAFLRGEAIPWQGENGWQPVRLMGFPLGWSKVSGGQAKNHYPKALRRSRVGTAVPVSGGDAPEAPVLRV